MNIFNYKPAETGFYETNKEELSNPVYHWVVMLQSGEIATSQFEEYLSWADANPAEAEKVEQLIGLWERLNEVQIPKPISLKNENVYYSSSIFSPLDFFQKLVKPTYSFALLAVCFTLISLVFFIKQSSDELTNGYQTARAEMTSVNLADGSVAHMNVLSKINVDFSEQERRIFLTEGEASFDVKSDSNRPFIVSVNGTEVYALGTKFNVKINPEGSLGVTLLEGRIRVSTNLNDQQEILSRILSAPGEQAIVSPLVSSSTRLRPKSESASIEISTLELSKALSWREQKLIFEGQSLKDAIAEINRYTNHTIELVDSAVANEAVIYGVFNSGDWEGFVSAVELSYPIKAINVSSDTTALMPISVN